MNLPGFLQFTPHERKAVLALLLFTGGGGLLIEAGRKFPRYAAGLRQATETRDAGDTAAAPAPAVAAIPDTLAEPPEPALAALGAAPPRSRHGGAGPPGPGKTGRAEASAAPAGPIDVNRADAAALTRLPGIGPKIAERIVADRAERGPFRGVDDLARVKGIGPATVARLRSLVVAG